MTCHRWAGTCYDQPIHQIWSFQLHPLRKYDRRCKLYNMEWFGWLWVTQGHQQCRLFDFNENYAFILYCFWDIASYLWKVADFNPPMCVWRPMWGDPMEFHRDLWCRKTRISGLSCGVVCVICYLAIFVEHQLVMDRQTHTQGHSIYHANILSRGKNYNR